VIGIVLCVVVLDHKSAALHAVVGDHLEQGQPLGRRVAAQGRQELIPPLQYGFSRNGSAIYRASPDGRYLAVTQPGKRNLLIYPAQ